MNDVQAAKKAGKTVDDSRVELEDAGEVQGLRRADRARGLTRLKANVQIVFDETK